MDLTHFIGRFHLVVLHLPIGLMVALVLLELTSCFRRNLSTDIRRYRRIVAIVFALTSLIAAFTGLLLRQADGGSGEWLDRHMWLGLLAAALSIVYAVFASLRPSERPAGFSFVGFVRTGLMFVLAGVISAAGHFGGEVTHGRGFLTQHAPQELKTWLGLASEPIQQVAASPTLTAYEQLVRPILEANCIGCHGPDRRKGDLALHLPESVLQGGKNGPAVVPGSLDKSLLYQRITLPQDHEDHMPPQGKTPLSAEQIDALRWWIAQGADFEQGLDIIPAGLQSLVAYDQNDVAELLLPSGDLDIAAVTALQQQQITVQRVSRQSDLLWIEFSSYPGEVTDEVVQQLRPVAGHIGWLDLSNTAITDRSITLIAKMPVLEDLNLRKTQVSLQAVAKLLALPQLKRLNLTEVELDDSLVDAFLAADQLERLYLWGSGLSRQAIDRLRAPRIHVIGNDDPLPPPLEVSTQPEDEPEMNSSPNGEP